MRKNIKLSGQSLEQKVILTDLQKETERKIEDLRQKKIVEEKLNSIALSDRKKFELELGSKKGAVEVHRIM